MDKLRRFLWDKGMPFLFGFLVCYSGIYKEILDFMGV